MGCLAERTTGAGIMGKICTALFLVLWVLELCALILAHQGISAVIPEITFLPENLIEGFQVSLGIGELKGGMETVQAEAEKVLVKCGQPAVAATLETFCTAIMADQNADTTDLLLNANADAEKAAIVQAFEDGLAKAKKVVTDDYFGKPEMASAADGLTTISDKLAESDDGDAPCRAQNQIYCGMREAAVQTLAGVDDVNKAIDSLAENDSMDVFKDQVAPQLPLLHIVPYVFVLSLVLFTFFWSSESAGACCKSKIGVCCYIFHFILGWVGNGIAIAVVAVYLALGPGADRIEIPEGILATDGANLQILKDHISDEFPELWELIFEPFGDAGTAIGQAFMVFLAVGLITIIYGILVCIIRPYKKKDGESGEGEAK